MKTTEEAKSQGVTLAEILIAVVIIGVIALSVIPTVVSKFQERSWNTGQKKFLKTIADVSYLMNVNGDLGGLEDTEAFVTKLSKYLKTVTTCDEDELSSCFSAEIKDGKNTKKPADYKDDISTFENAETTADVMGVRLNDGQSMLVAYNPQCSELTFLPSETNAGITQCLNVMYDVNGDKKPNTVDKDIFTLSGGDITDYLKELPKGAALPTGTEIDPCYYNSCYSTECEGYEVCECEPDSDECKCEEDPCYSEDCAGYDACTCAGDCGETGTLTDGSLLEQQSYDYDSLQQLDGDISGYDGDDDDDDEDDTEDDDPDPCDDDPCYSTTCENYNACTCDPCSCDSCYSEDCDGYDALECNCASNSCYSESCDGYDACTCAGECDDDEDGSTTDTMTTITLSCTAKTSYSSAYATRNVYCSFKTAPQADNIYAALLYCPALTSGGCQSTSDSWGSDITKLLGSNFSSWGNYAAPLGNNDDTYYIYNSPLASPITNYISFTQTSTSPGIVNSNMTFSFSAYLLYVAHYVGTSVYIPDDYTKNDPYYLTDPGFTQAYLGTTDSYISKTQSFTLILNYDTSTHEGTLESMTIE